MIPHPDALSRRDALKQAAALAFTVAVAPPALAASSPLPSVGSAEVEFLPENDYPFFGGELPEAYRQG